MADQPANRDARGTGAVDVMAAVRSRPLILNVDNDAANRQVTTQSLLMWQMSVIEAETGAAALALIADRQPLLVLLNVGLTDIDGRDMCRRIKAGWPDIVVIQLSASAMSPADNAIDGGSGADCYLATPVAPDELIAVTRVMLRLRQAEIQVREASERSRDLAQANEVLRAEICERDRTDEYIRQLKKMEALGRLTGGIAHDFNNLLTAILGGLEVTRRRIDDPRSLRLIDSSINAAQRGARLIAQLMTFARRQSPDLECLLLNPLVHDMQELLERRAGSTVQLSYELAADIWPVMVDASQVQTALLNLAINARDAMPDGGSLRIATSNLRVSQAEADLPAGEFATLVVQDSGTGMSEEVRERLFEPFFTTKSIGKGSGLGLAQVYGFARQSGGSVRVHSIVGEGTTITILLPRAIVETAQAATAS